MQYLAFIALAVLAGTAAAQSSVRPVIAKENKVDFRIPVRSYRCEGPVLQICIEAGLWEANPTQAAAADRKLRQVLPEVLGALPQHAREELRSIRYHLMWGIESPLGGVASGMRYVGNGDKDPDRKHDPQWKHAVVIYSTRNWMYLDDLWSRKALAHELAHAWHLTHRQVAERPILEAWRHAVDTGLYKNVAQTSGQPLASAYALTNQLEYFAEVSAAYFVGINYHPFDRKGLKSYDPAGHRLVEDIWALK